VNTTDGKGILARFVVGGVAVIAAAAWLDAQYQVQSPGALGRINPQVDPELYGRGTVNSIKYSSPSSVAMPSEIRNAYWRSGALPSDIRMGYAALGPLHSGGPLAYIPPPPSYLNKPATPLPPALGASAYGTAATIRYSAPAGGAAMPAPRVAAPMVSPAPLSSGPINAGPLNSTVRYAR
jgi:hypothetical protein